MVSYTIRRLLMLIPVLIGMSLLVFSIVHLIPGDPAKTILGEKASPEVLENMREELGLNDPLIVQYKNYMVGIFKGDLGTSIKTKVAISEEIRPYLAATIELTFFAMAFAILIGVNAGIIAAWKQNSWFDYIAMLIALLGVSMPVFWLGLMEQWVFAQKLNWLPSIGRDGILNPVQPITNFYLIDTLIAGDFEGLKEVLKHLILPSIALGTIPMAIIARMTRSSMLEVMNSDYIRTAKAKGVHQFFLIYKHALKNAFIPILTVVGLQTGLLLGGAVLTETIFAWPGIGKYLYDAIAVRDYPVIQSGILVIATIFVLVNLIVDLLYSAIDPRIRYR
ncbi:ABC transporter permease [Tepidibacillus infernus]|uniref:Peptide ABC transporter permease n=1 Tax=Tepidibacillus decaturensis TaxID=1413211 RepID=A0A135L5C3_9BACI|nr:MULTISPECIES: ABC transporter permease [Tepidibacillus]KXG44214.1 peptide ABC transporter permease [Tepidibacillus decaturensis]GBF10252.1 dipeptide transport system permease protein DppB [Tepidibacillus sp. HK-1]